MYRGACNSVLSWKFFPYLKCLKCLNEVYTLKSIYIWITNKSSKKIVKLRTSFLVSRLKKHHGMCMFAVNWKPTDFHAVFTNTETKWVTTYTFNSSANLDIKIVIRQRQISVDTLGSPLHIKFQSPHRFYVCWDNSGSKVKILGNFGVFDKTAFLRKIPKMLTLKWKFDSVGILVIIIIQIERIIKEGLHVGILRLDFL